MFLIRLFYSYILQLLSLIIDIYFATVSFYSLIELSCFYLLQIYSLILQFVSSIHFHIHLFSLYLVEETLFFFRLLCFVQIYSLSLNLYINNKKRNLINIYNIQITFHFFQLTQIFQYSIILFNI